ncbi:hypothetical protein LR48_Vigan10g278600 [Vigna angularis]|uniref:Disease resistance N-terminal domain-containing protein n=1 Tax=Phaseolus angularis TaxID=3914 RepID=A0A0L9VQ69_PHAAN|nr:hypothetical protein LR48_Vigan10g278600 [Vigna angularis]
MLHVTLHINALADDAKQKQFRDPRLKTRLYAVKEVMFDVEDFLDEIDYQLTRCKVEVESEPQIFVYKVSDFFNSTSSSFNKKTDSGMKEVLEKLDYLARQNGAFGFKECTYSGVGSSIKV